MSFPAIARWVAQDAEVGHRTEHKLLQSTASCISGSLVAHRVYVMGPYGRAARAVSRILFLTGGQSTSVWRRLDDRSAGMEDRCDGKAKLSPWDG